MGRMGEKSEKSGLRTSAVVDGLEMLNSGRSKMLVLDEGCGLGIGGISTGMMGKYLASAFFGLGAMSSSRSIKSCERAMMVAVVESILGEKEQRGAVVEDSSFAAFGSE